MSQSTDRRAFLEQTTFASVAAAGGWLAASTAGAAQAEQATQAAKSSAEARLKELKIELPATGAPSATFVPAVQVGNLLFVSGHISRRANGTRIEGKLGGQLSTAEGKEAAQQVGLWVLATVRQALGSLDKVVRTVKVLGMVNATPDFAEHPQVINGFSDLLVQVFGEQGKGARSAVGMGSLPGNAAIEIEAIFEVR